METAHVRGWWEVAERNLMVFSTFRCANWARTSHIIILAVHFASVVLGWASSDRSSHSSCQAPSRNPAILIDRRSLIAVTLGADIILPLLMAAEPNPQDRQARTCNVPAATRTDGHALGG